jgi:transposase
MESTGTYWLPVWRQLEGHVARRVLANPQQVKALSGRKTDPRDAQRIAEFLADGRLDPSFVPPVAIRQLRELVRRRVCLVQEHNRWSNRIEKLLQSYGVKLSSVASDILTVTGRRILRALADGQTDAERLSWRAVGSLRAKEDELCQALRGAMDEHACWLLGQLLDDIEQNEAQCRRVEERIRQALVPYAEPLRRLRTIPGVDETTAATLIAELGVDMSVFPSERHLASWAGLCPGAQESAGKWHSTRTRKGNRYLRRALVQSAWACSHAKRGYLRAVFYRVARRRGEKKAIVAVAHRILVAAYFILRDATEYVELGEDYFDLQHPEQTARRLTRRLERLGYRVTVQAVEPSNPAETATPAKRPRGRPCKCGERGIDCKHKKK